MKLNTASRSSVMPAVEEVPDTRQHGCNDGAGMKRSGPRAAPGAYATSSSASPCTMSHGQAGACDDRHRSGRSPGATSHQALAGCALRAARTATAPPKENPPATRQRLASGAGRTRSPQAHPRSRRAPRRSCRHCVPTPRKLKRSVGAPHSWQARARVCTTLLSMVPPYSGCGWQTTANACGACAASACGASMSACRSARRPRNAQAFACAGRAGVTPRLPPGRLRGAPAGG